LLRESKIDLEELFLHRNKYFPQNNMRYLDKFMMFMDLEVEVAMVEEVKEEVEVEEDLNLMMKILNKHMQQEDDPIYMKEEEEAMI